MNSAPMFLRPVRLAGAVLIVTVATAAPGVARLATSATGPYTTPTPSIPVAPPAQIPATAAAHTQTEALAFLIAIDEQMLAMATQARNKPVDRKIHDLAVTMQTDSRRNLADTRALAFDVGAQLVDTTEVSARRTQGRSDLEALGRIGDDDYGSRFLVALLADANDALDLIDKRLIPDATDERVVEHLQASRTRIAAHLLRAQELQSSGI